MANEQYMILDGKEHFKVYLIYAQKYEIYLDIAHISNNYIQLFSSVCEGVFIKGSPDINDVNINFEYLSFPVIDDINNPVNVDFRNDMTSFKNEAAILLYYQLMSLNLLNPDKTIPGGLYHRESTLTYHVLGYKPT